MVFSLQFVVFQSTMTKAINFIQSTVTRLKHLEFSTSSHSSIFKLSEELQLSSQSWLSLCCSKNRASHSGQLTNLFMLHLLKDVFEENQLFRAVDSIKYSTCLLPAHSPLEVCSLIFPCLKENYIFSLVAWGKARTTSFTCEKPN